MISLESRLKEIRESSFAAILKVLLQLVFRNLFWGNSTVNRGKVYVDVRQKRKHLLGSYFKRGKFYFVSKLIL